MFIFDGGVLDQRGISRLRLVDDELAAFRFFTKDEASDLLRPYVWRRVEVALDALRTGQARYLEDGHVVDGGPNPHDEGPAGPRS
jgi:hypothetical protein